MGTQLLGLKYSLCGLACLSVTLLMIAIYRPIGLDSTRTEGAYYVERVNTQRVNRVHEFCDALSNQTRITLESFYNILVDDRRKLLYCAIPKVACTNWKRALGILSGHTDVLSLRIHTPEGLAALGLRRLSEYPREEIQHKIDTYFKFIFVRNPFTRLLSAYRDKFEQFNALFWWKYNVVIKKLYRALPSDSQGINVSFTEFLQLASDMHRLNGIADYHWANYTSICIPCYVKYNFIGKFEHLDADAAVVLEKIASAENLTKLPDFHNGPQWKKSTEKSVVEYYKNVPYPILARIKQTYMHDFMMFGYNPAEF